MFRFSSSESVSSIGLTQTSSRPSQKMCSRIAGLHLSAVIYLDDLKDLFQPERFHNDSASILVPLPVREEGGQTEVEEMYKHFGCCLCLVLELLWVHPTTPSIKLTQAALPFISCEPQARTKKVSFEKFFLQNIPAQVSQVAVGSTRI